MGSFEENIDRKKKHLTSDDLLADIDDCVVDLKILTNYITDLNLMVQSTTYENYTKLLKMAAFASTHVTKRLAALTAERKRMLREMKADHIKAHHNH